ncbi:MAG: alpha/beta fold hydrolase [candidate division Zixibacteria bacterium]|nr:alpha/beta fold hydrolase [candidate division Zixibacteria bacterium]
MNNDYFLEVSGGKICYAEYGLPGGHPLFYFHGWPGSRIQARLAHETARGSGMHVIAPDRPGMGLSSYCDGRTMVDWHRTVLELADHLNWDKFGILGVSGGGPYALSCAAFIADRIISMNICSGVPNPDWLRGDSSARWFMRKAIALDDKIPGSLKPFLIITRAFIGIMPGSSFLQPAKVFLNHADRGTLDNEEARDTIAGSIRESFKGGAEGLYHDLKLLSTDWGFKLGDIKFPVIFWHGALDPICPISAVIDTIGKIGDSKLIRFENESHYSLPIRQLEKILKSCIAEPESN